MVASEVKPSVVFPVVERGHRNQSRRKAALLGPPSAEPSSKVTIISNTSTATAIQMTSTSTSTSTSLVSLPSLPLALHSPIDSSCSISNSKSTIPKSSSPVSCNPLSKQDNNRPQSLSHKIDTNSTTTTTNSFDRCRVSCSSFNRLQSLFMISLLALILSCCCLTTSAAFQLDGSQSSFAQFRKWYVGLNGSLELEFKTEQPNGLVLYSDDGGTYDFFELKLVEGALRLRYNLGGGAQIITVGRDLHDGHWHKVQVIRNDEQTSLIVDGVSQSRTTKGKEFQFGKFATNSDVYVGGMPNWYSTKLALLALPSVIFEPRFRGSIRNLVYADQPGGQTRRQEMKQPRDIKCGDGPCDHGEMPKEKVTRNLRGSNTTDACERHDPCQHGGICISTDSGPICECRNLEYDGQYCEKEKAPSEATFRGTQFLSYDLGQTGAEPIVSAQDAITLYFRTRQPNGLLFYTGHGTDYLNLALRDGGVSLTMGLANGKQEMHIKPSKVRFDDHQWHKVTVHRRIQEISSITSFCRLVTVVDDVYTDHSHIAGKFTMLSSSRVYVGGAVNPRALLGARVHNNFVGCLRKVEFSADTLLLNLIDLAKSGSKLIQVAGNVEYQCPIGDPQDPVTFTTRESHLVLPPWETGKQSSIGFKFRTKEPNGLIIMATGSKQPRSKNPVLFAIELLNGHIYIHLDLGSGAAKVRGSRRRVDDGDWHDFILRRNGRDAKVSVDGVWNDFRTPGEGTILELDGHMYVGGTGPAYASANWPPAIWTATLRQGFVGCLRDLVLSGKPIDIAAFARLQDSASVKPSCHVQANVCAGNPCLNGGTCVEGWNRPVCDCTSTLYYGPTCGRESATLVFNGTQHMTVWLGNGQGTKTQTEELLLRFKTGRPTGLLLMTSAESNSPDRLEIALVAGRIRASVRLSDREKNLLAGQSVLNDNNWHTIRFSRRASNLRLQVDGAPPVRGMLSETILGRHSTIEIRSIHLGGLFHAEEEIQMTSTMPNFIGQMQGFIFNGQRYIDIVKSLGPELSALPSATFKLTARFVNSPPGNPYHAATFRSKHSYVGLPMLKAYSTISVDFRFKTVEPNGLLLYNGGRRNDFVAVELVNGHIHYTFDLGDGPITMRDKTRIHMNDNRWHQVSIRRPGPKTHTLAVDDSFEIITLSGNSMHLELSGILYIGGVFKDMYSKLPASISSRSGFEGCISSLDLGDTSPSLTNDAVVPSSLVVSGCEGPTKCSQNACANRGVCVQQWNAYACECDMTSYTGPTCYDETHSDVTTDSVTRRQDSTTEQQTTTTISQTTPQQTTALSTVVTTSQTSPPTTVLTTSTQRTTSTSTTTMATTTTTTTAATPTPEIRTTATERDTTTYDVVHVFKSDDKSENSNMVYPQIPEDRLPPPPPPPIHDTEGGLPYFPLPPQTPPYGNNNYRPKGKGGRINSIEEERTAMIIGIVAGILIAVILVILLVLWLKSNGDRNYKTAGEKTIYGTHNPNASLLGNTSTNGSYHQQRQQSSSNHLQTTQDTRSRSHSGIAMRNNGNADMCGRSQPMRVERVYHDSTDHSEGEDRPGLVKTKKRDSKDVKEWYV
uniref:Neurexin-1 n=1 Tax=Stomoxys calcitrans TaxID=35570 RepID=A0A1I8PXC0_STOCA